MSLAENLDLWVAASRKEARDAGEQSGLERGRQEGERLGLNRGRREAALLALEIKFGDLGLKFWIDHFASQQFGRWEELVIAIKKARSLDELHPFRPR